MSTQTIRQIIARSGLDAYNEEISAACDAIDAQMASDAKLREALEIAAEHLDMSAFELSYPDEADLIRAALSLPTQAKRDREADRARFPDTAFNTWLDESITENGEFTAWDSLSSTGDAYAGWSVRSNYAPTQAEPVEGGEVVDSDYKQALGSKNCMQFCVAYMLGLPLEAVPDFEREHCAHLTAWELMEQVFESHGCTVEMFPPTAEINGDYLASGTTDRGTNHMVVMRGGRLLHDPHPSNAGLESVQVVWIIARKSGRTPPASQEQAQQPISDEFVITHIERTVATIRSMVAETDERGADVGR